MGYVATIHPATTPDGFSHHVEINNPFPVWRWLKDRYSVDRWVGTDQYWIRFDVGPYEAVDDDYIVFSNLPYRRDQIPYAILHTNSAIDAVLLRMISWEVID